MPKFEAKSSHDSAKASLDCVLWLRYASDKTGGLRRGVLMYGESQTQILTKKLGKSLWLEQVVLLD